MHDDLRPDGPGNLPGEQRPPDTNKQCAEGALSGNPEMLRPDIYRAALRPHRDEPLSALALAALWKQFCRRRRGVLRDGWESAWRNVVEQERRAVEHFKRRRERTLEVVAKGKAAAEAALVRALTPEQRAVETDAEKAVHWARYRVEDKRRVARNTIIANALEPERQAAREALRLAETEVVRFEADHKRIVEEHRRETYKRISEDRRRQKCKRQHEERERYRAAMNGSSWAADRERSRLAQEEDAKWLRSIGTKAREIELEKRKAAAFAAHDERRAEADKVSAMMARLNDPERVRARKAYDERHKANSDPVLGAPASAQKS
jgi:hypothetical protein